jgi:hypothetical protein
MTPAARIRLHWDRVSGWGLVATGAGVLAYGWWKVSKTPYPAEQMPYIVSAGIVGALLVIFGAAMLISADLRDEWHKLDRVETLLVRALDAPAVAESVESDWTSGPIELRPREQSRPEPRAAGHRA